MISPAQIRAGRHLLGLSQADVAIATGLSLPTIKRAESDREVSISADATKAIQAALEAAGVEFTNGEQPGVRISKNSFGRRAMPNEIRIGDRIMQRDNIAVPFIRSIGSIGDVVDPGHTAPDATKVYVRFPNGDEGWVDRGCLVLAP
jgi:transcriptional regulator with XRE-family HTH domain